MQVRIRQGVAVALVALSAIVAGCGGDDDAPAGDGSPSGSPEVTSTSTADGSTDEVCAAWEAVKDSIAELTRLDLVEDGTSGLEDALGKVMDDLRALRTSGAQELEPQVQSLEDSLSNLEAAVENTDDDGAGAVGEALGDVVQAATDLVSATADLNCGGADGDRAEPETGS